MRRNQSKFAWKICVLSLSVSSLLYSSGCHQMPVKSAHLYQAPRSFTQQINPRILTFGDSITSGYGVPSENAYPQVLSQKLEVPVISRGKNGDTTATALQRLEQDVLRAFPNIVIVELGGNDFLQGVPLAETEQNLKQIIQRVKSTGAIAVLLGMNVKPFNGKYGQMYQRVANETQAHYIPGVLKGLNQPQYRSDQIHPNAVGHDIIATRIAEGLKPLLSQLSSSQIPTN